MTPETREQYSSHIPALKMLMSLGWDYLSAADCLAKRGSTREVILKDELIAVLQQRRYEYRGEWRSLSANAIDQIVRELSAPGLNEGLLTASEKLYDRLCLGITVTEFIDGKRHAPTIAVINWNDPAQNRFQVTEELEVVSSDGTHTRRPDLVGYVNGLPLVVIEAKRPDAGNPARNPLDEGVSQQIRNQKNDEIPLLFAYSQLLLARRRGHPRNSGRAGARSCSARRISAASSRRRCLRHSVMRCSRASRARCGRISRCCGRSRSCVRIRIGC